ncbi:hypothetical protein [Streptomyces sp. NPDC049879]|uniref:hypothetical protein n=1 Tax=Streptomyces sp. NPDC049879 TaxID=3365598 RepID=UPI00378B8C14
MTDPSDYLDTHTLRLLPALSPDQADRLGFFLSLTQATGEEIATRLESADQRLADGTQWAPATGHDTLHALRRSAVPDLLTPLDAVFGARRCLDAVLGAEHGERYTDYDTWERQPGRTLADVRRVIGMAAHLARTVNAPSAATHP